MKKFFRNLFSGYFLIILLLLIELGAFIFFQFFFEAAVELLLNETSLFDDANLKLGINLGYLLMRGIAFFIALIIFFKIINRHEDPEFKIPWIVGMLLYVR